MSRSVYHDDVTAYMAEPEQEIAESSIDDNMYELDEMLIHLYETADAIDGLANGRCPGSINVSWLGGPNKRLSLLAPAAFRYIAKKIDRTASYDAETGVILRTANERA